jgi:hypothetical protein
MEPQNSQKSPEDQNINLITEQKRNQFELMNLVQMLSQRTGRKKSKRNGGFPKLPTTSPRKERNRKTRKNSHGRTSNKRRNVLI